MTSDALRRLQSMAEADDELMASLQSASTRDEVVRIAAANGLHIEPDDLDATTDLADVELLDAELESAAGGWHPKYSTFTDSCL